MSVFQPFTSSGYTCVTDCRHDNPLSTSNAAKFVPNKNGYAGMPVVVWLKNPCITTLIDSNTLVVAVMQGFFSQTTTSASVPVTVAAAAAEGGLLFLDRD